VRWSDPSATSVSNAWGMTCSIAAGSITCRGADFGAALQPGTPVQAGVQVVTSGPAPTRPTLSVS
jgi:endoglucanase